MMPDHYYTTPRSGNNMNRYRRRFSRQGTRESWPYGRVLRRRRLNDSFSSNNFHRIYHECECSTRWNYDSPSYPRHLEPYYPDDDYMKDHRTGLTPAYQMLRLEPDQFTFFVEKSKLEAILGNASGIIDKSNIPVRIELKDPLIGLAYRNITKEPSNGYSGLDHVGFEGQQRPPYSSTPSKVSDTNDEADSDDSDTTVYFHETYPKGKVQNPECSSSRNDNNEENSSTRGYGDRGPSFSLKDRVSYSKSRKYSAKMNNDPWWYTENNNNNAGSLTSGYFTEEYKEDLQRNAVEKKSPEVAPVDLAIIKRYGETRELANQRDVDFSQGRSPSRYSDHSNGWYNNDHNRPVSSESPMQRT